VGFITVSGGRKTVLGSFNRVESSDISSLIVIKKAYLDV